MTAGRAALTAALIRRLIWIAVAGLITAALAVGGLALSGPVSIHLALAVLLGTFFTFLLGGGLFALSFYSARGGYDQDAAHLDDTDRGSR